MKKNVLGVTLFILFCIPAVTIKSEDTVCKNKCPRVAAGKIKSRHGYDFAGYGKGAIPKDEGFIIRI